MTGFHIDILRRQVVGSDANQGAGATGAVAAAANAVVNAAVKGVDATVIGNNIANDVLNNPDIRILSSRQIVGSSANQGAGATGAVAAAANAVANAAVKGVDATVTYNTSPMTLLTTPMSKLVATPSSLTLTRLLVRTAVLRVLQPMLPLPSMRSLLMSMSRTTTS